MASMEKAAHGCGSSLMGCGCLLILLGCLILIPLLLAVAV